MPDENSENNTEIIPQKCKDYDFCSFRKKLIPGQEQSYCLNKTESCKFEGRSTNLGVLLRHTN
ncbi:MAG: hypothetical protein WCX73_00985 [Candidatus Pacearchaeota archaeon]|jgi:hypothetical protein